MHFSEFFCVEITNDGVVETGTKKRDFPLLLKEEEDQQRRL